MKINMIFKLLVITVVLLSFTEARKKKIFGKIKQAAKSAQRNFHELKEEAKSKFEDLTVEDKVVANEEGLVGQVTCEIYGKRYRTLLNVHNKSLCNSKSQLITFIGSNGDSESFRPNKSDKSKIGDYNCDFSYNPWSQELQFTPVRVEFYIDNTKVNECHSFHSNPEADNTNHEDEDYFK